MRSYGHGLNIAGVLIFKTKKESIRNGNQDTEKVLHGQG